jgi:methylmalonyl-CoA mutase
MTAPSARGVGDVGKSGRRGSVEDMKVLLDGIPLDRGRVSMTMNGADPDPRQFYRRRRRTGDDRSVRCLARFDIPKEFMVRNTYVYPPEPSMQLVANIIEFTADEMPKFNSISISVSHAEVGANLDTRTRVYAGGWARNMCAHGNRAGHDVDVRTALSFC